VDVAGVNSFTWSPDGQQIAFTTEPETQGGDTYNIYLFSTLDLKLSILYEMLYNKRIYSLDWSPQGDQILAMWQDTPDPMMYLRLFNLSGEYLTVDTDKILVYDAEWDPNGGMFAFAGDKVTNWEGEIWMTTADNTHAQVLVQGEDVFYVNWSPNGKKLTYTSGCCSNPSGISVIEVDTKAILRIVPNSEYAYYPSWSPDGAYLAFLIATDDTASKGYSLNVYSFDTGKVTKIVNEMVVDDYASLPWQPAWQP
jgi:Tol biopolymer transport system component